MDVEATMVMPTADGSKPYTQIILQNIEVLEQTQRLLGSNVQEALALEVGLLKLKL